ncbi:Uncharacterised protein [Anaerotruncus sp. 2789STDY5834896]|uniref:Uncharacterized protein n=1 Tax=uncultured Anaerotruncus sp. TaxID=905011 RepID=A0A1C6IAH0_9FIRM|nr:Uncharacterised protein [uncultured Anaerotruncus sp.]
MGVVLGKAAHPHQAVQRARELVPVHQAQLAHPQRQVAIGAGLGLVHQHAAGAVHRFDGVVLLVDDGGVHVVFIVIPVTAALPQRTAEDHRRADLYIAGLFVDLAPVVDQGIFQFHAFGQEKWEARSLLHQGKQFQLFSQLAVVALFGLLEHGQMGLQLAGFGESGAVYPAEHGFIRIAAPVGAGRRGQLDSLYFRGVHQVGAGAQVAEVALFKEGDLLPLTGVLGDELQLVGLVFHQLSGLIRRQLKSLQRQRRLYDLFHLGLDLFQVLGGKGLLQVKIVVKAAVDSRADGKLGIGVQVLHRLGQNVRGGVPEHPLARVIGKGQHLQCAVVLQRLAQVGHRAVDQAPHRIAVKAHRYLFGHIGHGAAGLYLQHRAVF